MFPLIPDDQIIWKEICTQNVMTLKYVVEEYTRNSQQGGADKFLMLLESR